MSKNVLITGATSGIGEATARAFAEEGENLILTGRRVERLQALKEELQATYPNQKVWTFALDVTDMDMIKDVCQAILKSVGQVHVLVNNAGLVKTQLRRYTRYNPREGTVQEVTEYDFRGLHP